VGAAKTPAEREADQVAAAVTGGEGPTTLLVDEGPVAAGQMRKSTFLAELRQRVSAAADEELGPFFSAAQENVPLSQHHLLRAINLEYRELGKLSTSGRME
jgi:hypothetical protein